MSLSNFLLIVCVDVMIVSVYFMIRNGKIYGMVGNILDDIQERGCKKVELYRFRKYVKYEYVLYARALTSVYCIERQLRKKIFEKTG